MSSSTEKKFNRIVKEAMIRYQNTVEAKSLKITLKHGQSCISHLEKALELIDYMGMKEKKPYIYEYMALTTALLGTAYLNASYYKKAQERFIEALDLNKKSMGNQDTYLRQTYIHMKLTTIGIHQKTLVEGLHHAESAFNTVKKVKDPAKVLPYLRELKELYIGVQDDFATEKIFKSMLQFGKTFKNKQESYHALADIYSEYGDFLLKREKSEKELKRAEKLYKKALKIYQKSGLDAKIQYIQEKLKLTSPE